MAVVSSLVYNHLTERVVDKIPKCSIVIFPATAMQNERYCLAEKVCKTADLQTTLTLPIFICLGLFD